MSTIMDKDSTDMIKKAVAGDQEALETVALGVRDRIFNLSLRMLGTFEDAEDATQDIILKVITRLSSFKEESAFTTWVFRIAANHLINCKKHQFANARFDFSFYGEDIENGPISGLPDMTQNADHALLSEELKLSCTNVMLQCLDKESRLIFVLGTMFRADSRIAGEVLGITAEAYRQRLLRVRKKVAEFLSAYCGEYGSGKCRCRSRLNYAIMSHRLNPTTLKYTGAKETAFEFKQAMEEIDALSAQFSFLKIYESPEKTKRFFQEFLASAALSAVKEL